MKKNDEDRKGWVRAGQSVIRGASGAHNILKYTMWGPGTRGAHGISVSGPKS